MADDRDMSGDEKLAKAELVREKTGASFEDARAALEASGYDVLDAIVWLEARGKVAPGGARPASYTTEAAPEDAATAEMAQAQGGYEQAARPDGFARACNRMLAWVKAVFKKSVEVTFVIERKGKRYVAIPLLLLIVLALIPPLWLLLPVVILSLFFDVRYRFEGVGPVTVDVNRVSEKMSEGAEALKRDVMGAEAER